MSDQLTYPIGSLAQEAGRLSTTGPLAARVNRESGFRMWVAGQDEREVVLVQRPIVSTA